MQDLRIIDPMRPEISARYNPFWAPEGNAEEHVGFVFESFNMEKDFFEGHQRVYLENIARVLHYSGKALQLPRCSGLCLRPSVAQRRR